jgi:hypothetical protein
LLSARAQAPRPIRIGILDVYSPPDPWLEALRERIRADMPREGTSNLKNWASWVNFDLSAAVRSALGAERLIPWPKSPP